MSWAIMGKYLDFDEEEIDEAEDEEDADYLLKEYEMAYGFGWKLWKKEKDDDVE
jgi:hypothetical protein